jgi:hypothetical protein
MAFTDDDLKRLKEDQSYWWGSFTAEKLNALLARLESAEAERDSLLRERKSMSFRLEAAEECVEHHACDCKGCSKREEAWRKAAGKSRIETKGEGE